VEFILELQEMEEPTPDATAPANPSILITTLTHPCI
jgi:hypothetical protein